MYIIHLIWLTKLSNNRYLLIISDCSLSFFNVAFTNSASDAIVTDCDIPLPGYVYILSIKINLCKKLINYLMCNNVGELKPLRELAPK